MVIFPLDKLKKTSYMFQNSQIWLIVAWSADFESRLMPRSDPYRVCDYFYFQIELVCVLVEQYLVVEMDDVM